MIRDVLDFTREQLNNHFRDKNGLVAEDIVSFMPFNDDQNYEFKTGQVTPLLVNLQEEKILRSQDTIIKHKDGTFSKVNPEINMVLQVLFVSKFGTYLNSMEYLSEIISYFQSNKVFGKQALRDSGFDSLNKLVFELISMPFNEQNEVWNAMRTHYLPSVLFRVTMVSFKDQSPKKVQGINRPPNRNIERDDSISGSKAGTGGFGKILIGEIASILKSFNQGQTNLLDQINVLDSGISTEEDIAKQVEQLSERLNIVEKEIADLSARHGFFLNNNPAILELKTRIMDYRAALQNYSPEQLKSEEYILSLKQALFNRMWFSKIISFRQAISDVRYSFKKWGTLCDRFRDNAEKIVQRKKRWNKHDKTAEHWIRLFEEEKEILMDSRESFEDLKSHSQRLWNLLFDASERMNRLLIEKSLEESHFLSVFQKSDLWKQILSKPENETFQNITSIINDIEKAQQALGLIIYSEKPSSEIKEEIDNYLDGDVLDLNDLTLLSEDLIENHSGLWLGQSFLKFEKDIH